MSYEFNGTNQAVTGALPLDKPITMFARFSIDTNNKYQQIFSLSSNPLQSDRSFRVANSNKLQNSEYAGVGQSINSIEDVSLNNWHSGINGLISATLRTIQLNSSEPVTGTTNVDTSGANSSLLIMGATLVTGSYSQLLDGKLCECAIWSTELTDGERNSLAKGFSPRRIRPQSRVFYGPLIRNLQDLQRALALTPVNSPTVAPHPRVYA